MKFFRCHSIKMKNDKVIFMQDKYTDIGPDVFDGFDAEYLIFADTTKVIKDFAFSGLDNCSIYLPANISVIEPSAFENSGSGIVVYCPEGSYAEQYCIRAGLNFSNDCTSVFVLAEESKAKYKAEQKPEISIESDRCISENSDSDLVDTEDVDETIKEAIETVNESFEEGSASADEGIFEELTETTDESEPVNIEFYENQNLNIEDEAVVSEVDDREIEVKTYDEVNGEYSYKVRFYELSEYERENLHGDFIYVHLEYVNSEQISSLIDEETYNKLVSSPVEGDYPAEADVNVLKNTSEKSVESKFCLACGAQVSENDKFCYKCGFALSNIKRCPKCSNFNDLTDNFCYYCGFKLK